MHKLKSKPPAKLAVSMSRHPVIVPHFSPFQHPSPLIFPVYKRKSPAFAGLFRQTVLEEINPEKKGSVYDLKFQKTWIASCDEAEQLQIYRAAFRAYTAMNYAALGMFLVCFIGMLSWNFGLLPLTMVLFVWLTGVIVYGVESLRMTGGR